MGLNSFSSSEAISVVSGLPRSGTSMMMKMLDAGGIPVLTDSKRSPDASNPQGYYELERVKRLRYGDQEWLEAARGKAVKVISALLEYLPPVYQYKVLFMQRNIVEVLHSHKEMLARLHQEIEPISDEQLIRLFQSHVVTVEAWISWQPTMEICHISYNDLMSDPWIQLKKVQQFLGVPLNLQNMLRIVDVKLYRQRLTS